MPARVRFLVYGLFVLGLSCLAVVACREQAQQVEEPVLVVASGGEDSGALSSDAAPQPAPTQTDVLAGTKWPPLQMTSGKAWVDCGIDAGVALVEPLEADTGTDVDATVDESGNEDGIAETEAGANETDANETDANEADAATAVESAEDAQPRDDGRAVPLANLDFFTFVDAMTPCKDAGAVRVRYEGKISGDFTALMQRAAAMADRMDIGRRILDIDSTGGRIEDAIPAGDSIAESHWTIRVREDAICHSACVLVLAAGDDREIAGRIGIHRMIRVGSKATTRAELSQELRGVYAEIKDYLERNGASVAVADLMMTVPNRSLRLLTELELREYGLSGANAVQDDLDRIILARKCGEEFVKRSDAFQRAYASRCESTDMDQAAVDACALALREDYGFPDESCPAEGPLARTGGAVRPPQSR